MAKINQKFLGSIKASLKDQFIRDDTLQGFGIKVTPARRISFLAEGRVRGGGKTRRITLGQYPTLSIQEAKELAQSKLNQMQKGIDPVLEEKRSKARYDALSKTLEEVFNEYCDARNLKPKTLYDYKNNFNLTFSSLGQKPVRDFTRKDVFDLFLSVKEKNGDSTAAKFKRIGSAIFTFAMADEVDGERLIKENPFNVIAEKKIQISLKKRETFLDDNQISILINFYENAMDWIETPPHGVTKQGINYVMLLLTTGMRKSEALSLSWSNVDWNKKMFTVTDTKNKTNHSVPMSSLTEWLLKLQRDADKNSDWVFPSKITGTHMTEPKSQLERIRKATGLSFTFHDLRRTFATHADALGQPYDLIRRALNHKSGEGITSDYIITQIETLRPVFETVAKGYHTYYDPDWESDHHGE